MANKISDNRSIAPGLAVQDWREWRSWLNISSDLGEEDTKVWKAAWDLFRSRVEARYIKPISWISDKGEGDGEGFAVVTIQCCLMEFLQSMYEGKIFAARDSAELARLGEYGYFSSKDYFRKFLTTQKPFRDSFSSVKQADTFYHNIRCGLVHQASTLNDSLIHISPEGDGGKAIVAFKDNDSNVTVYRDKLQIALLEYIDVHYKKELFEKPELRANFQRRMDSLCGIRS